ncbi:MAG: hypothetical protein HYX71_06695 [Opitutae bacterium]|nr:hypothetical protein [Opitutae bacterium]
MNFPKASPFQPPRTLVRLFYFAAFALSVAVYVAIYKYLWRFVSYPIELEWREGSMWLHALAQSYGVNIFASDKVAYANANHGIFDHIIKGNLIRAFRFLEPQYILRVFVLLFPAISCWAIFVHSRRKFPTIVALISSLCLSGAMLIAVHDIGHWNTCIGRSDSTAFTLLIFAYLCYTTQARTCGARLLRHCSYLTIALVLSTNWRIYPVALMIPLIMEQHQDALRIRELIRIYLLILGYTLATCALFIVVWFHSDASMYYRYFFGFFSAKSPMPPSSAPFQMMIHYVRIPAFAFLIIFSVLPAFIEAERIILKHSFHWPRILAAIAISLSLLISISAFKMNFMAAGYWYLCPQAIVLFVYYHTRYKIGPGLASAILVLGLGILSRSENLPLMRWYYSQLGETLPAARKYTEELVLLDRAFGVYSEEAHLFKRSATLSPIDMGDVAEAFANANYYGPRFTAVFSEQKSRLTSHEPVLVFVGGCASSAVKELAENEEYCLWLKSPAPAIGGGVYVRVDHIEDVQRFLMGPTAISP